MGYLGAKSGAGVFQTIVALMPPHDTYFEIFVGSGAILARKQPAARSIALDLDAAAVHALPPLAGLEAIHGDGIAYLRDLNLPPTLGRVLIYADPPYVHATRTSACRYAHELSDDDHRAMAAELRRLSLQGAMVIVSGYPSTLYDELFAGWRTLTFQAMTRGGPRTEKLWFNFDQGDAHWHTFAGRNFTDRQRIKRKADRWAAKFRDLAGPERQAVFSALLAAMSDPSE